MKSEIECAIFELFKPVPAIAANTLQLAIFETTRVRRDGNELFVVGPYKYRTSEIRAVIDGLIEDGVLQKALVPKLPREFRAAEPVFARSHGLNQTRLNYSLAEQLAHQSLVPLVTRSIYFLTENSHIVNRLIAQHESAIRDGEGRGELLSPLLVQLRLATFLANNLSLRRQPFDSCHVLSGAPPHFRVRLHPITPSPLESLSAKSLADDECWQPVCSELMHMWKAPVGITATVLSVAQCARIAKALLKAARPSHSDPARVVTEQVENRLPVITAHPEEAHLFLASS